MDDDPSGRLQAGPKSGGIGAAGLMFLAWLLRTSRSISNPPLPVTSTDSRSYGWDSQTRS